MALIDDVNVRWPDGVLPGSESARILAARNQERAKAEKAERQRKGWSA